MHGGPRYSENSHPGNPSTSSTFTPSSYSKNTFQVNSSVTSAPKFKPTESTNTSNWQPMPQNIPTMSSYNEGWQKDGTGASWTDHSGNISGFEPINVRPTNPNVLTNVPQRSQEPFTIGEWSAPADSSSQAASEPQQVQKQPSNTQEEDLHEQWLEVQRNWREGSVQSGKI